MIKGQKHSKETIERIRQKKIANPTKYWKGKSRSEETNLKISNTKKGNPMTEENKNKIRLSAKNNPNYGMRGKHQTKDARIKIGLAAKGRKAWNYLDGKATKRNRLNTYKVHKIWCSQPENFYRVPDDCVIHHLDLNPMNNDPKNLILLPRDYHSQLHNEISKIMLRGESLWQG